MILRPSDEKVDLDLAFSSEIEPERSKKGLFKGQLIKPVKNPEGNKNNSTADDIVGYFSSFHIKVPNLFGKKLHYNFMKF